MVRQQQLFWSTYTKTHQSLLFLWGRKGKCKTSLKFQNVCSKLVFQYVAGLGQIQHALLSVQLLVKGPVLNRKKFPGLLLPFSFQHTERNREKSTEMIVFQI